MGSFGRILPLLTAVLALAVADGARANTFQVGRLQGDCPGGCDFYDFFPSGTKAGFGIVAACSSASVVSGDTVLVWRGSRTANNVFDYPGRIGMKSGVRLMAAGYPDSVPVITSTAGGVAGITMTGCSEVTEINGFIFTWDSSTGGLGGGIAAFTSGGKIINNRFVNCSAGVGAGVYLQTCSVEITNNLFMSNTCGVGGGVVAISGGTPTVSGNTFYRSTAPIGTEGADIYATGSDFTMENNILYGSLGASSVFCGGGNLPTISCNMFWANQLGTFAGQCPDSTGTSGNVIADPLFCDAPMSFFGVCSDSPALGGSCGTIGYISPFGSCASCRPTSVEASFRESSWGTVKALYR